MGEWARAGVLQNFASFVRELGGEPDLLLHQSGLDPASLRDPESRVSLYAVAHLLENAARHHRLPTFGLQLGNRQDLSMLGLLTAVVQNSTTVYDAAVVASRYLFFHSPSLELVLEDPSRYMHGCVTLRFDIRLEQTVPQRQHIDAYLSSTYRMAQILSPDRIPLRGVFIPHTPTGPRSAYRAHFNATVTFEQPYAALHFDRRVLDIQIDAVKPHLRRRAAADIAAGYPGAGRGISAQVRSALKSTVGANRGTKAEIADLLNLHPRALQRRLSAEQTTFESIRASVYRSAAYRLLLETDLPLAQVAAVLGFSEQSAMTRSVRRWFGATPAQIRKAGSLASQST